MSEIGKILVITGAVLLLAGAVVMIMGRMNVPIGRLPGDFTWRGKSGNTVVFFPIVTSIVLSVLLTLVLWVINSFRR